MNSDYEKLKNEGHDIDGSVKDYSRQTIGECVSSVYFQRDHEGVFYIWNSCIKFIFFKWLLIYYFVWTDALVKSK